MMFEHFETIVPYGRKDCGGSLYGLHHEIHYAFEHMLHMSHKDIMDWLWHHQLPEKVLLADACSYLVAHGCYYSRLATDGSLGAALLKYYTPEELTKKWSVYGVTVRVNPYGGMIGAAGLDIRKTTAFSKAVVEDDLPF